jgi:hypothetical protein
MAQSKEEAQKAIEDAALTIGADGAKDMVFALSQVEDSNDHARAGIVIVGDPNEIVKTIIATMHADRDFKKILLSAVNGYVISKFFNRRAKQCDCPDCIIARAIKS